MTKPSDRDTILIVDDLRTNALALGKILNDEWNIISTQDGPSALEIANQTPGPDLILLDVRMPGMDGYEVCRRLKASPETMKIPVIFISAAEGENEEALGLQLGAADYILKPPRAQVVRAQVRNQLTLRRVLAELESKNRELERVAMFDRLTGLYNRRKLDELLEIEVTRSERYDRPLSVILFDLDKFKSVNDTYGHPVGDIVLSQTAANVKEQLRSSDFPCRWGGEEFLVICPETGLDTAAMLTERLRQSQAQLVFPKAGTVSASYGVAAHQKGRTAKDIVQAADEALYRAKKAGRNRIEKEKTA
jgi:diguanylate cyclase (GGDEF)-like protein